MMILSREKEILELAHTAGVHASQALPEVPLVSGAISYAQAVRKSNDLTSNEEIAVFCQGFAGGWCDDRYGPKRKEVHRGC